MGVLSVSKHVCVCVSPISRVLAINDVCVCVWVWVRVRAWVCARGDVGRAQIRPGQRGQSGSGRGLATK